MSLQRLLVDKLSLENSKEVLEPVAVEVSGTLPEWLNGRLYRTGAGTFDIGLKNGTVFTFRHWFDALTTVHLFKIDGQQNKVEYRNRQTAKDIEKQIHLNNGPSPGAFGEPVGLARKASSLFKSKTENDLVNVGVTVDVYPTHIAAAPPDSDDLELKTDHQRTVILNPHSLEPQLNYTIGKLNPKIKGGLGHCAHPQVDRERREVYNFVIDANGPKPKYVVYRQTPAAPLGEVVATFSANLCYVHSFAMTEKYVILILCPYEMTRASFLFNQNILDSAHWKKDTPTHFHVISREEKKQVGTFSTPGFWMFHTVNAWEEKTDDNRTVINIDLVSYPNADIVTAFTLRNLRGSADINPGELRRFTLDMALAVPSKEAEGRSRCIISESQFGATDMPRINSDYSRKENRYIYFTGSPTVPALQGQAVKVDTSTGSMQTWTAAKQHISELVFVPRPGPEAEDDGVLLGVALSDRQNSSLVCLNAKTMQLIAEAKLSPGLHIPMHFHGNFFDESEIRKFRLPDTSPA